MFGVDLIELPAWAQVNEKRHAHIARVTALLDRWASELRVPPDEARAWHDAGIYHDALRDAPEAELRALVRDPSLPPQILHGPAAAERLRRDGENREDGRTAPFWHRTSCTTSRVSFDRSCVSVWNGRCVKGIACIPRRSRCGTTSPDRARRARRYTAVGGGSTSHTARPVDARASGCPTADRCGGPARRAHPCRSAQCHASPWAGATRHDAPARPRLRRRLCRHLTRRP